MVAGLTVGDPFLRDVFLDEGDEERDSKEEKEARKRKRSEAAKVHFVSTFLLFFFSVFLFCVLYSNNNGSTLAEICWSVKHRRHHQDAARDWRV